MLMLAREDPRSRAHVTTVAQQQRRLTLSWWRFYVCSFAVFLVVAVIAIVTAPHPFSLALLVLILGTCALLMQPEIGLYLIVFFTMAGDSVVAPWYPFAKNLSSRESILFVADPLTISPLEILVVATAVSWLLRGLTGHHRISIRGGRMLVPLAFFTTMVMVGFVNGVFRRGGDLRIAIFEARALFLLLAVYLLIVNIFDDRRQYVRLFVVALVGVMVQSIIALVFYRGLSDELRGDLDSLTEHGASIHLATLFILTLAVCLLPNCTVRLRCMMLTFAGPALVVFALSQRRSGFNALALGVLMFLAVLFVEKRRTFWWFAPTVLVLGVGYILAFWGTSGPIGFGAQAVKSFIAPEQLDAVDRSSDLYREIEATNLWFTIRAEPVLGVGFGNRFLQPWPLPDLGPGFEFRDFLPHNSLLWIWLKTGYVGFVSVLVVIARAMQLGARSIAKMRVGNERALMVAALGYVLMYTVFTYVDIGWDARSVVFLAIAIAWCTDMADVGPHAASEETIGASRHGTAASRSASIRPATHATSRRPADPSESADARPSHSAADAR